jgi:hypothetical protein
MLEMEGYNFATVDTVSKQWKPLHFSKVVLIAKGVEDNGEIKFLTSEVAEDYQKNKLVLINVEVKKKENLVYSLKNRFNH